MHSSTVLSAIFAALSTVSVGISATAGELKTSELEDIERAALHRDLATLSAPIRSQGDLARHISQSSNKSPLNALSRDARARFLSSLRFGERGLASFQYSDLEAELTPTQIYTLLSLFGQQHVTGKLRPSNMRTPLDNEIMSSVLPGLARPMTDCGFGPPGEYTPGTDPFCGGQHQYYCESPGTCAPKAKYICTENC